MNSNETVAARLLASIEEFVGQEILALRAGDYPGAMRIQERAAPVISRLCHLGAGRPAWWTAALGRRLDAVLARRRQSRALVAAHRKDLSAERDRLAEARRRLWTVAPAYAGCRAASRQSSRLNAAV